jgi:acyl-CoA hydrolase
METYKTVLTSSLNSQGTLFGGQLLKWVDEYAWTAASLDFPGIKLVTRAMDSIDFTAGATNGSILRFVIMQEHKGITSVTYHIVIYCNAPDVKNEYVLFSNNVTFVAVDSSGKKVALPL